MEVIKFQGEITEIKNRKNNRKKFMRKKNFFRSVKLIKIQKTEQGQRKIDC